MGICPRVAQWDDDGRKDLLIGHETGELLLFLNVGTNAMPEFDAGSLLMFGPAAEKDTIDVGGRATPVIVDWNEDGRRDLVVGSTDGKIHIFLNEGTDTAPDYLAETFAQEDGEDLVVPWVRTSPAIQDLDGDGKKDLLTGNAEGRILLYQNVGSNEAPEFSGFYYLTSDGQPIDIFGFASSRPFLCSWTDDEYIDMLVGASDGNIHLFLGRDPIGVPEQPMAAIGLGVPWPNPFNPNVTLPVSLAEPGRVRLTVHDIRGRLVATLLDGLLTAGRHEPRWDGRDLRGGSLPSGLYIARLEGPELTEARKLVLIR